MSLKNFRASDFKQGSAPKKTKKAATKKVSAPEPAEVESDSVPEGTTKEILAWVGDDKERAASALDAEKANEKPRKSVVEPLEEMLAEAE
jgi:hypothetical protein